MLITFILILEPARMPNGHPKPPLNHPCAMLYRLLLFASFSCFLTVLSSSAQNTRLSVSAEAAIVADLESKDIDRIFSAIEALPYPHPDSSYKDMISYSTALALIAESERQTDLAFNSHEEYLDQDVGHEFASGFSDYAVALKMPEAIPALLKATQFGNPAAYALADFGPNIVHTIIEYMEDPDRTLSEIDGGFYALEKTLLTWRPLDPSIRSDIKEITIFHLEKAEEYYGGPDGSITAILGAIYLAGVLGDEDLKQMLIDIIPYETEMTLRFGQWSGSTIQRILDEWPEMKQEYIDIND